MNPLVKINNVKVIVPLENTGIKQDVLRIPNRLSFATISLENRDKEKENGALYQHAWSDASLAPWFMWIPKQALKVPSS